jgi:hypothetical protein
MARARKQPISVPPQLEGHSEKVIKRGTQPHQTITVITHYDYLRTRELARAHEVGVSDVFRVAITTMFEKVGETDPELAKAMDNVAKARLILEAEILPEVRTQ